MSEDDDIRASLERLIVKRDKLTDAIEALEKLLADEEVGDSVNGEPGISRVSVGSVKIVPGEFFNQSQTDAAAAYLKKVKHAVSVDQILEALKAGGIKFEGAEPKASLYTVLVRATKRFVLVSPNTFGLIEWYPDRKKKEKKSV
jgi:hypothetical protein